MAKIVTLPRADFLKVVDSRSFDCEVEADPETGLPIHPEGMKTFVVAQDAKISGDPQDPKMTVIPHFFSEAECDHLIQLVEGNWMPSLVGGANYVKSEDEDMSQGNIQNSVGSTRTSWSCMLRYAQTDIVERLEERIGSIAKLPHGVAQLERMNMVRYAPGEHFNEHHDGKFRPKTVFVYLNDLPDDAEQGDTFFPVLGLSFKPRRGTAVMWSNAMPQDADKEDSRMVHAGRAPSKGVKYGVNCFLNEKPMREIIQMPHKHTLESAAIQRVSDLADGPPQLGDDGWPVITKMVVVRDPKLVAIPNLLSADAVEHILQLVCADQPRPGGAFGEGTQVIQILDYAATPIIERLEVIMCSVAQEQIEHLAKLRIVRPGMKLGLCNRGCGKHSIYVCLCKEEEVFFPALGIRFLMQAGDALLLKNVNFDTGLAREELRQNRVHRCVEGGEPPIGIDAYFHDNPLRAQQKVRNFVSDAEILSK